MSESALNSNADSEIAVAARSMVPTKTIAWIGFLVFVIFLMRWSASWLDDRFGVGLDVINVTSYLITLVILASLVVHFLFFSKFGKKYRIASLFLLFSFPLFVGFCLRPVFNGDMGIARFEPIWPFSLIFGQTKTEVSSSANSDGVDLANESEFDFPRFLGTSQNASVENPLALDTNEFSKAETVWRQPIGEGWSGFTARNGFAVTMEQRGELECVTCYDILTGELKWKHEHQARHLDSMRVGGIGPRSTPTIHEGKVYSMGAVGHLVCLNGADGKVIWEVDMNELLGIEISKNVKDKHGFEVHHETNTRLTWGRAGSPLIVDDKVVVAAGGPKPEADAGSSVKEESSKPEPVNGERTDETPTTLIAFDKITGEIVWRGGEEAIGYGSPTLVNVSTVRQIMLVAESLAMGFDPDSGEVLWDHPRPGDSGSGANCSQVTVISDNYILTSKGYPDGGGELIALEIEEGKLAPKSVWSSPRVLKTKLTNPIILDGHSYSISNGYLECVHLANGERIWKNRKRVGHGQILRAGSYLLVHSEKGTLYLIDPTPEGYRELGSFPTIDGVCWNTLCLYGPYLLVRSELEAACFKLPIVGNATGPKPTDLFEDVTTSENSVVE